jgi:hypothetical protein
LFWKRFAKKRFPSLKILFSTHNVRNNNEVVPPVRLGLLSTAKPASIQIMKCNSIPTRVAR